MTKFAKVLPVTTSFLMVIALAATFFAIPGRIMFSEVSPGLIIYTAVVYVYSTIYFIIAGNKDPGVLPKCEALEADDSTVPVFTCTIVKGVSIPRKWCSTCKFYRPPRVSHCSICDSCIEKFDHHCNLLNNCIGSKNYKPFLLFLSTFCISLINIIVITLWYIIRKTSASPNGPSVPVIVSPEVILSIVLVIIAGISFLPIFGLIVFHCTLLIRGRTTNEQVTGKFKYGANPFDLGWKKNSIQTLCSPENPTYKMTSAADISSNTTKVASRYEKSAPLDNKKIPGNGDAEFIKKNRSLSSPSTSSTDNRKNESSTQKNKDHDFPKKSANRKDHETKVEQLFKLSTNPDCFQEHLFTDSHTKQEAEVDFPNDERYFDFVGTSESGIETMEMVSFMTHHDEDTIDQNSNG